MPSTYTLTSNPGGLFAIDADGVTLTRRGVLAAAGTYPISVTNGSVTKDFTITATAAVYLSISGTPEPAYVGVPYSFIPTISNPGGTVTASISGTLPAGLSFNSSTGAITGTPTTVATYTGTITVNDGGASPAATLNISITVAAEAPAPANSFNWDSATQFTNYRAAKSANTRRIVLFLGDSTTAGVTGSTTDYRTKSAPSYCAAALSNGSFDSFVSNANNPNSDTSRVILGGAAYWTGAEACGGPLCQMGSSGDYVRFTPAKAFDRVRVVLAGTGSPSFDVRVNGTPTGTTRTANGSGNMEAFGFTIPATAGGATVDVVWRGGSVYVQSVECYDTAPPRIDIINGGRGGQQSSVFGAPDTGFNYMAGAFALTPHLTFINIGINDGNFLGTSKADYKSAVDTAVVNLKAKGSDVILVVPTPVVETSGMETTSWTLYRDALQEIGVARNCPVINLHDRYVSYSVQHAKIPPWMNDTLHPEALLYEDLGKFYASFLALI